MTPIKVRSPRGGIDRYDGRESLFPEYLSTTIMSSSDADAAVTEANPADTLPAEVLNATPEELATRTRLLENDVKIMRSEQMRLMHEHNTMKEKIKDNSEKIKQNKVLPYLVGNVVEVRLSSGVTC